LRYEKKNQIHVHHDVIYQFAVRLKAIIDKACPVDFFPQTVRGAVRLLLAKSLSVESENLSVDLGKKWSLCYESRLPAQQNHFFGGKKFAGRKLRYVYCTVDYKKLKTLTEEKTS
jgi:hypothetical protein